MAKSKVSEYPDVQLDSASIVVRGFFRPLMITPAWLKANGLLGESEAGDLKLEVKSGTGNLFETGWLRCEVSVDRLQLSTRDEQEFERLRDIAVGILTVDSGAPVALLGLNREMHIAMPSEKAWHSVGDAVLPKALWADTLKVPGMRSVTVEGVRDDGYVGNIQVTIQPSTAVTNGLYVFHNDHYVLRKAGKVIENRDDLLDPQVAADVAMEPSPDNLKTAIAILNSNWSNSLQAAEDAVGTLWKAGG